MSTANLTMQADGTALLRLDAATAQALTEAARASNKGPVQLLRQAIDDWRERDFDRKAVARLKRRKPSDPAKAISHADLKHSLGL